MNALRGRSSISGQESGTLAIGTLSPLPSVPLGTPYSQTLFASGGTTPYTWTIIAGAICSGIGLSSSGIVSGTPTLVQTCSFTVQVADAVLATDSRPFTLTVTPIGVTMGGKAKIGGTVVSK